MFKRIPLLICLILLCVACSGPQKMVPAVGAATYPVYVVGQGWHTGIALPKTDLLPESADFPDAKYLEFGWGDRDYYQADDPGVGLLLQAAFCSSGGVLHVVGVRDSVTERFGGFEIVKLEIPQERFVALVAFIRDSFQREAGAAKALPLRRGFSVTSLFYPAVGGFYLFNNCNTWVARALEAAGYAMGWPLPVTSGQLLARVRRLDSGQPTTPQ